MHFIKKEIEWGGKTLSLETGRLARQANGSVLARHGDSAVLATVCVNLDSKVDVDFVPLSVHYQEKCFAAGKIPGGFFKREGKSTEREMLISRLIDRPLRPTISEGFNHEIQVICTVLSYDSSVSIDILGIIASSAALQLSGVPNSGTIAACKVTHENSEFHISNTSSKDLDLVVAGSKNGIIMVESQAFELSEEQMIDAIKFGHSNFQPVIKLIEDLKTEASSEQIEFDQADNNIDLIEKVNSNAKEKIAEIYNLTDRKERNSALKILKTDVLSLFSEDEHSAVNKQIDEIIYSTIRNKILTTKSRIDGRGLEDIRNISIDVDVLPKVHGSAVFTRGETQSLAVVTLGAVDDEQVIDSLDKEYRERFILHYNFPPYSVGEAGRMGPPGRREIGHGKLAWRAFNSVIPKNENEFSYTIRVVSEILESNGSSSMATVCSTSLALMDAGVPIRKSIAGIAMGLVVSDSDYAVLSDISGDEDHFGDMDFKVAGTEQGINALQMDIKTDSISFQVISEALHQAKRGRLFILDKMNSVINDYNSSFKSTVPKIKTISIPKDKIRDVIGSGGKVIRGICDETGVKIDISDDGTAKIFSPDNNSTELAYERIKSIISVPEVDKIYEGFVCKIKPAGVIVQFGNNDGWLHISEISDKRIGNINNILKQGTKLQVKVIGIESSGRVNLTIKGVNQNPLKGVA